MRHLGKMIAPALACLLPLATSQEPGFVPVPTLAGEDLASIEWGPVPAPIYPGQEFCLIVHLWIEASAFEDRLVQPFHKSLDIPCSVTVPGLESLTALSYQGPTAGGKKTLAFNGAPLQVHAPRTEGRGGSRYRRLEVPLAFLAGSEGSTVLPAPLLNIATAEGFRDDLLLGRAPLGVRHTIARGTPLTLTVQALPEAGRPLAFQGAVGAFRVWATSSTRHIAHGEVLRLSLEIEGPGSLGSALGGWPALVPGFQILARTGDGDRRVELELTPGQQLPGSIPAIALETFEPGQATYIRVQSEPIPLEPTRPARSLVPAGEVKHFNPGGEEQPLYLRTAFWAVLIGVGAVSFLGLRRLRRKNQGESKAARGRGPSG